MQEYTEPPSKGKQWRKPRLFEFRYTHELKRVRDRQNWNRALRLDTRLGDMDRLVGAVIVDHFNLKTGRCDPAYEMIALQLGIDRSTAIRAVKRLCQYGWLRTERRLDQRGKQLTNQFWPRLPQPIISMFAESCEPGGKSAQPGGKSAEPSGIAAPPKQRSLEQRTIEHSVLRTATPDGVASFEDIYQGISAKQDGPSGRERSGVAPAKPYSADDVELVQAALNDGAKTYAGIIAASQQPGAIGDDGGSGVNRAALRDLLNDCISARLVWTERSHGKDYFFYHDDGVGRDWIEALGLSE